MCDSLRALALIDHLNDVEYTQAGYPAKGMEDTNTTSADFRSQYTKSPLTGAGFCITPLGMPIRSSDDAPCRIENRMQHGRIAGYVVEFNPPACIVGHNRVLVNGVPAAAKAGVWLLKYWLAENGCTQAGLDA